MSYVSKLQDALCCATVAQYEEGEKKYCDKGTRDKTTKIELH